MGEGVWRRQVGGLLDPQCSRGLSDNSIKRQPRQQQVTHHIVIESTAKKKGGEGNLGGKSSEQKREGNFGGKEQRKEKGNFE